MVLDICAMLVLLVCAYENWSYCILLQALRETNTSSEWLIVRNLEETTIPSEQNWLCPSLKCLLNGGLPNASPFLMYPAGPNEVICFLAQIT